MSSSLNSKVLLAAGFIEETMNPSTLFDHNPMSLRHLSSVIPDFGLALALFSVERSLQDALKADVRDDYLSIAAPEVSIQRIKIRLYRHIL